MRFRTAALTLLGRDVVLFRRPLADICDGDQVATLFLGQALYWTKWANANGWFYKSAEEWKDELCLTRRQLERVRGLLQEKGFLQHRLMQRAPAVMEYRVDLMALETALNQLAQNGRTSLRKMCNLACTEPPNKPGENVQPSLRERARLYKEAEITSESSEDTTKNALILPISEAEAQSTPKRTTGIREPTVPRSHMSEEGRRLVYKAARVKGNRNFDLHPLEDWEEPLSCEEERAWKTRKEEKARLTSVSMTETVKG